MKKALFLLGLLASTTAFAGSTYKLRTTNAWGSIVELGSYATHKECYAAQKAYTERTGRSAGCMKVP